MRVELDGGEVVELGTTETNPTIGIVDYSRRVTDAFGVTTVVERGFARTLSVKLGVDFDQVDSLQRRLADLRATSARWVADDRFAWLSPRGFYKDFDVDLSVPPLSICSLTVEGLAATEPLVDAGGDPAPIGQASTLQLVDPVAITDPVLVASSVPETDAEPWSAATTYVQGARVVRAHRIWESLTAGNVGAEPSGDPTRWLDTGPTNRWAPFDQALGTATTAVGSITTTLRAQSAVSALAVLDTDAGSVRVQAPGYDRTRVRTGQGTSFLFLDLVVPAGADVTVTINAGGGGSSTRTWSDTATWDDGASWADTMPLPGAGSVTVGTILIGQLRALGLTEASPSASITDYSRKETDDFGAVTVVERAWAKRMTTRALIRTDALDLVANRLAAVRARPVLWVGQEGLESLTVYGFAKEWSIEVGATTSKLSLSIEGLSKAGKVKPFAPGAGTVAWPDVTDPTGTKPQDGATVGAPAGTPVAGVDAGDLVNRVASFDQRFATLQDVTIPAVNAAVAASDDRITKARTDFDTRIGAARDDLAAEAARAKGAEEQLAERISSVVADGTGYDDAAIYARVGEVDRARADGDRGLGERITSVEAGYSSKTETAAAITETARTLAAADKAIADRTTVIEATARPGGNLVPNSAFSTLDGWIFTYNADLAGEIVRNGAGSAWQIGGVENNLTLHRGPARAGFTTEASSIIFAVRPGSWVQLYALVASHRCRGWVSAYFYDAAGAIVAYAGENFGAGATGGRNIAAHEIVGVECFKVPDNAVAAAMLLRQYDVTSDGYVWFHRPFFAEVQEGTTTWAPYSPGNDRPVTDRASARLSTVETATTDGRFAAAERVGRVEARLDGVPAAINARVETAERAAVDADRALGSRSAVLEAVAASSGTSAVRNDNFNFWPDGLAHPSSWGLWVSEGNYRTQRLSPGRGGGQYCIRTMNDYVDANSGFVQVIYTGGAGKWVIEVTADFDVSGARGAGVTLSGIWSIDFCSEPDVAGVVGDIPNAVRSWSKMVELDGRDQINVHAMHGWTAFGRGVAPKYMVWHRLSLRPATDGEIKAGKADAALNAPGGALARIKGTEDVLADLPNRYATTQRASTLEAQVNFATDSGLQRTLNARIEDRATAIADSKTGAVAQTVQTLRTDYEGTKGEVTQQAAVIAGLNGKTAAYIRQTVDAGNGIAQLTLWSDQYGGAWELVGDGRVSGNLLVTGSVSTGSLALGAVSTSGAAEAGARSINSDGRYTLVSAGASSAGGSTLVFVSYSIQYVSTAGMTYTPQGDLELVRIANGVEALLRTFNSRVVGDLTWFHQDVPPAGSVQYLLRFTRGGGGQNVWVFPSARISFLELKR